MSRKFFLSSMAILFALSILGTLFFSCASSQLSNMWRDPSYSKGPITSMFIITMKKDPTLRRIWEDGFVNALAKYGVEATPSYQVFPGDLPDTNQVGEEVRTKGYEGVLVVTKLPTDTITTYVPGYVATEPVVRYNPWLNEYFTHYRDVYYPGYTETEKVFRHEVNVWTTKDGGRLIWSGTGEVLNPNSSKDVNAQIIKLIVPELARQGIIPAKKK
jgi:hypothetical protein